MSGASLHMKGPEMVAEFRTEKLTLIPIAGSQLATNSAAPTQPRIELHTFPTLLTAFT